MENQKLTILNSFINNAYECSTFTEFLKHAIVNLHELVMYDSGMFFCGISRDCSFFKPFVTGRTDEYYRKQTFIGREDYLKQREAQGTGSESMVYRALDLKQGVVTVSNEPRLCFLTSQEDFYIACMRIVYKGQFMGEIYLHRSKENPDFSEEDLFVLRLLQSHVSTIFHFIHTITAVKYLETDSGRFSKKGLCLLDTEMSITGGNATGLDMLKISTVFGSSILYHVKELCEDMLADQKEKAEVTIQHAALQTGNGTLLLHIILHRDKKKNGSGTFFISMEYQNEDQVMSDYKFKFTKREADIIDGIIQGKNNAQLAAVLNLSENTIKTHIQSIYRKAGANNRTELAYILLLN